MKTILFILAAIFSLSVISAQTKLISHKSHSGSDANFALALKGNLFNISESNLGLPTTIPSLDSVIYISEEKVVTISSERFENGHVWRTKKDTLKNDELFSKKHSLDSIKSEMKKTPTIYNIDSIVFVGYDNHTKLYKKEAKQKRKREKKKEKSIIPVGLQNNETPNKGLMILGMGLFSFLVTWVVYRFSGNFRLSE
ncbi:hypothetical protein [Moheibacter sediminis]|uniref:LPXTG-motif cell wall anchor domain-containing protein n=1 Tax=Moheibacter sediminis TaxID=1434700 RepID=A0A1W2C7F0_9FLAO|nr:hypothetical protein [Moheibacter sediminis]SMC81083.1 hypothetical protein SAMN06296427_10917 [Moheibacter sediminis]